MGEADEIPRSYLYDQPVLVVDPDAHTAEITRADVDAVGQFAVTASHDRTVRVWSLTNGSLLRTIRLPSGPASVGKAYSVALDPAGEVIAVGGQTSMRAPDDRRPPDESIYLYDRATGTLQQRISGLPNAVVGLVFGPGGEHLAATLMGPRGLRVYARSQDWAEVARDPDYEDASLGVVFAPDGRLATTSRGGWIRLYAPDFQLLRYTRLDAGLEPYGIAFSPSGERLAVGFANSTRLAVLDAQNLTPLYEAATAGIDNGDLGTIAWAAEDRLHAAGRYSDGTRMPVLAWTEAGRGTRQVLLAVRNTVVSLRPLPTKNMLVVDADRFVGCYTQAGAEIWSVRPPLVDFAGQRATLGVASDGVTIDFGFERFGEAPARFDLGRLTLTHEPPLDECTTKPPQTGLPGWHGDHDRFGGVRLLGPHERTISVGIHPDRQRFVLGTEWDLRAFDVIGRPLWQQSAPGTVWAVNITGDGRLVVAAYGDGAIRWHRMDDGREILAFIPLADRRNWIVSTPEGFYAASQGAHGMLRWHVNQPGWQPAKAYAVADIPGFYRPEAIKLVLQEMETPRAIGLAVLAEQREKVRLLTNSRVPLGARLHVVAVGISEYDPATAAHLRLRYADKDAQDVMSALAGTQDALYVPGYRETPRNEDATGEIILRALNNVQFATQPSDLTVFHFSGHGAKIGDRLYLLPRDVRPGDSVSLQRSALSIGDLRDALMKIAERGRVLVLLDACYSGGASLDGGAQPVASSVLSTALAAANLNVLTSSSESQTSREDPRWQNGAFTAAFLEALGAADENKDGLISAPELAAYVGRRVRALTGGAQQPGMEIRFDGTLFAVR